MRLRFNLFSTAAALTAAALVATATVVVLEVTGRVLGWSLVAGPAHLSGLFRACLALDGVGVALCLVLGIREIVKALKKLLFHEDESEFPPPFVFSLTCPQVQISAFALALVLLVAGLHVADRLVQRQRNAGFKKTAAVQIEDLRMRLSRDATGAHFYPDAGVPKPLQNLARAARELPFVATASLFFPDPDLEAFLWQYTPDSRNGDRLVRRFASEPEQKAVLRAVGGAADALQPFNQGAPFVYLSLIKDPAGAPVAVLRIEGRRKAAYRSDGAVS